MAAIYLTLMVQLTGTKSIVGQINDITSSEKKSSGPEMQYSINALPASRYFSITGGRGNHR